MIKFFRDRKTETLLFLVSFLTLYVELLFIRWLPLVFRLLAYYSNLILIAALFGMGLGMIIAQTQERRLIKGIGYFFSLLILAIIIISQFSFIILPLANESNFVWNGLSRTQNPLGFVSYAVLVAIFMAITYFFVFLGHEIGRLFNKLEPLRAYSVNIAGSILGVLVFALISAFSMPPIFWLYLFVVGLFLYVYIDSLWSKKEWFLNVLSMATVLLLLFFVSSQVKEKVFWSPYYEIKVEDYVHEGERYGFNLLVNQDSHQQALDLSGKYDDPFLKHREELYELPYNFYPLEEAEVLVLGSGTGNDVAAALRSGVKSVDAVEIDPIIADLGKTHPEDPYADDRVTVIVDDARSFLEKSDKKYDYIIFGFLDSHRLFSSMSSVRLENYLYTVENIENVRDHLKDDGLLVITYTVHEKWIADRIYHLLASVFGDEPLVFQGNQNAWGTSFLSKKLGSLVGPEERISPEVMGSMVSQVNVGHTWAYGAESGFLSPDIFSEGATLPTDSWPHLFLKERGIPTNYIAILSLLVVLAVTLVMFQAPRLALKSYEGWIFFFLGAAFVLLETKGITDLAILLGTTWVTNTIVIVSVLTMILIANYLVARGWKISIPIVYLLLSAVLVFDFFFSFSQLFSLTYGYKVFLSGLQIGLPILFSGILFALYFKETKDAGTVLGANLLGSVFGGFLEYSSLLFEQNYLFILALFFYLLTFYLYMKSSFNRS